MNKKELKEIITEAFDNAIFTKSGTFTVHAREDMPFCIEATADCSGISEGIRSVNLNFDSGFVHLKTKDFSRTEMIDIFTTFIWAVFIDYED